MTPAGTSSHAGAYDAGVQGVRDLAGEVRFLARELKTPVITETYAALGDQARQDGWSHEEYLAAVLGRQVASRTANGTRMRISAAHFPVTVPRHRRARRQVRHPLVPLRCPRPVPPPSRQVHAPAPS
jgi:hypothetical protein